MSAGLEGERGDVLLLLQRGENVVRSPKLLLGAAQQPAEHPEHSRDCEDDRRAPLQGVWEMGGGALHVVLTHFSLLTFIFLGGKKMFPAVAEDASRL